jgi:glutaredoxin
MMRGRWHLLLVVIGLTVALAPAAAVDAAGLDGFGRCLKQAGATFYGASWCPHCAAQRQTLGDAMSHVRYVECSEDGDRGAPARPCKAANVSSYPTWVFADGSRASGEQSLEALAAKTGCTLPRR